MLLRITISKIDKFYDQVTLKIFIHLKIKNFKSYMIIRIRFWQYTFLLKAQKSRHTNSKLQSTWHYTLYLSKYWSPLWVFPSPPSRLYLKGFPCCFYLDFSLPSLCISLFPLFSLLVVDNSFLFQEFSSKEVSGKVLCRRRQPTLERVEKSYTRIYIGSFLTKFLKTYIHFQA